MSAPQQLTIQHFADHCQLAIEYVDDVPSEVPGYLDPSPIPRFIAIDIRLSREEQVFTIAHEIAHFVLHHGKPRRNYYPFILERHPENQFLAEVLALMRRYIKLHHHRDWEADGWAIIILVRLGETKAVETYLERHPENSWWAAYASIWWTYLFLQNLPIYRALTR